MVDGDRGTPDNSRLKNLEASYVDFGSIFAEQLHRNYDIEIAGQYVSCNSKYLFKDGLRSGYSAGDSEDLRIFHLNHQGLNSSFNFLSEICELSIFQVIGLTITWLNNHNSALLDIPGYTFYRRSSISKTWRNWNLYTERHRGFGKK